ncbi:hypothetical protein MSAN_00359900 [Mycena sanguinolenta]|uniref:Arrestin-like N-terminal domain-containing protein n=1 Tax=Mycena sanguinolenta TaxID=230812 RepID=A0A8H6ZC24_9AGAR|nr:hypothetical protein MSAN_00359900 [Mycena sanguinolenta]
MANFPGTHSRSIRNPFQDSPPNGQTCLAEVEAAEPPPSSRQLKEFTFDLLHKSGKPWATLLLRGDAEHSKTTPAFVEGAPVTGEVRLDLESGGEAIHAVALSIKGQIITGALPSEMVTFVDLPTTLWSRSMGDPRNPTNDGNKWSQKLKGKYIWPFSISLPPTVSLPYFGRNEVFHRLPESFFERHTRGQIEYEIAVRFTRPKLRTDHKLSTTFNYLPLFKPGPPSGLRQLAYSQHTALLGPDSDTEGWQSSPSVKTRGKLSSSSRSVDATCTLSLATPLCYTRGTTIPCALLIECDDPEALYLLSSPEAVVMRLRRNVRFHTVEKTTGHYGDDHSKLLWKEELVHSELATWWPAADRSLEIDSTETLPVTVSRKMLRGELYLRSDLITSTSIAHFRIEYSVVLFPFDAPGYEPLDSEPIIVEPVEIASEYADGPLPIQYSSPLA